MRTYLRNNTLPLFVLYWYGPPGAIIVLRIDVRNPQWAQIERSSWEGLDDMFVIELGLASHLFFISFTSLVYNTDVQTVILSARLAPAYTQAPVLPYFTAVRCCREVTRGKASGHRSRPARPPFALPLFSPLYATFPPCLSPRLTLLLLWVLQLFFFLLFSVVYSLAQMKPIL